MEKMTKNFAKNGNGKSGTHKGGLEKILQG